MPLREGFSYVFKVGAEARVVAMGGGFLAEGDTVRIVDAPAAMNGSAASAARVTPPKP